MSFMEIWIKIWVGILMLTICFGLISIMLIGVLGGIMEHDINIIKTECYDKFRNEINNITCDKEILCNYKWDFLNYDECEDVKKQ